MSADHNMESLNEGLQINKIKTKVILITNAQTNAITIEGDIPEKIDDCYLGQQLN